MKKLIVFALVSVLLFGTVSALSEAAAVIESAVSPAYADEMKIPYTVDLSPEDGADSVERAGDHQDSPYFRHPDFFHMEDTDTLTILTGFRTQQQTSEWSCGVSSVLMVLDWYRLLGGHNEESLAAFRSNGLAPGATSTRGMIEMLEGVGGLDVYSAFGAGEKAGEVFTLEFVQKTLSEGKPILIGWNDWGGHWQVIIGYDTMGTETQQDDVLIVADPYDTTDHNQDGYGIYPAERFIYNFTFYDFFPEEELNDWCFIVPSLKK